MTDFPTLGPLLSLQHKKKDGIRPPRSRPSVKDLVRSGERGSVTCPALTIGRTNLELFCGLVGFTAGVIERRDAPRPASKSQGPSRNILRAVSDPRRPGAAEHLHRKKFVPGGLLYLQHNKF